MMAVYNLPPWLCMKQPYLMLSLLIPGPKAPGYEIDVFLEPLIEELKLLRDEGISTYDFSTDETFLKRATILWTINNFPAHGNLSGWSTKGYKACPQCHDHTVSQLDNYPKLQKQEECSLAVHFHYSPPPKYQLYPFLQKKIKLTERCGPIF